MSKNDLHKSFTSSIIMASDDQGVIIPVNHIHDLFKDDLEMITACTEYQIKNAGKEIITNLDAYNGKVTNKNELGRILGIELPQEVLNDRSKGKSRYNKIFCDRVMREIVSWNERIKTVNGTTDKYVSQGWSRTADDTMPTDLKFKMSLSAVDKQFAYIANDPFVDGYIVMKTIIKGNWYTLTFTFPKVRFKDSYKVSLPDITVDDNGILIFHFSAVYEYTYSPISNRYIVGIDPGKTVPATIVVWDRKEECIAHIEYLPQEINSLHNSINASDKQKNILYQEDRFNESSLHRRASSRKKRELNIRIAQIIASVAFEWDNAVVAYEDLSWVENTMQNGRWSCGELFKWVKHYVELNGSRVIKINAKDSSQLCHYCENRVSHPVWKQSVCPVHGVMDRDVNSAALIAKRAVKTVDKMCSTRKKAKSFTQKKKKRSPGVPNVIKKKKKNKKTKKKKSSLTQQKSGSRSSVLMIPLEEVLENKCSPYRNDDGRVYGDDNNQRVIRTLKKQHKNYNNLINYKLL